MLEGTKGNKLVGPKEDKTLKEWEVKTEARLLQLALPQPPSGEPSPRCSHDLKVVTLARALPGQVARETRAKTKARARVEEREKEKAKKKELAKAEATRARAGTRTEAGSKTCETTMKTTPGACWTVTRLLCKGSMQQQPW